MRFEPILVAVIAQLAGVSAAVYGADPEVVQSYSGSSIIGDGNAVQVMPSGAAIATNSDGTLVVLDGSGGEPSTYTPEPIDDDSVVSSKSGVSLYSAGGSEYAIYAVMDKPGDGAEYTSRVIALDVETLTVAWSTTLSGEVAGTPLVGSDNEHVYVTHNAATNFVNDEDGYFSVLKISEQGSVMFEDRRDDPYAPAGIAHKPTPWANYAGGFRNTNDFVCWAGKPEGAIVGAVSGKTHAFQLPRTVDVAPQVTQLQEVGWVATTAPAFSQDGQEMFFSVSAGNRRGAEIRAWIGGKNFGTGSSWKGAYLKEGGDAPYASGALSVDDEMFYYVTTIPAIYGLNATDGAVIWEDIGLPGVVRASPVVSPDGKVVFFITEDGTVFGKDAKTGSTIFQVRNGNAPRAAASFSINDEGTMLYYGIAESLASSTYYQLKVGAPQGPTLSPTPRPPTIKPPTDPPTMAPTTDMPTGSPTEPQPTPQPTTAEPTMTMSPTPNATDAPTPSPTETQTEEPTSPTETQTEEPTDSPVDPPTDSPAALPPPGGRPPTPPGDDTSSAGSFLITRLALMGGTSFLVVSLFLL